MTTPNPNQEGSKPAKADNKAAAQRDAIKSASARTLEQFRKVLKERAQTLAREESDDEFDDTDALHVLQFLLNGEMYAFEGKMVREVRAAIDITPIPCTPAFVLGVINLRGEIVTILDTKLLLGLSAESKANQKLVVARSPQAQIGFLIDEVVGVSAVSRKELQGPLATMPAEQARRIQGLTGDPMVLIDVETLMSDPRIVVDEEIFD